MQFTVVSVAVLSYCTFTVIKIDVSLAVCPLPGSKHATDLCSPANPVTIMIFVSNNSIDIVHYGQFAFCLQVFRCKINFINNC